MLRIIGNFGCARCEMVKAILGRKNVDYTYENLEDLEETEKVTITTLAQEQGRLQMPLIFKDNILIDLKEI